MGRLVPDLTYRMHLGIATGLTTSGGGGVRNALAAVAELLLAAGYGIVHVETGKPVLDPAAAPPEGHLSAVAA